jgi:hypothetical protein
MLIWHRYNPELLVDRIKLFDRDFKPFGVYAVNKVMKCNNHEKPPEQESQINDRAPPKKTS